MRFSKSAFLLGKVVRPEGLELSTFWFVAGVVKLQVPYCPLLTGVFILESTLSWATWATPTRNCTPCSDSSVISVHGSQTPKEHRYNDYGCTHCNGSLCFFMA